MEVFEAIKSRRSIRAYTDAPVSREQLARVLEAIRLAPSWKDKQCCQVVVLSDRAQIRTLGELLRGNPGPEVFETAPCFLVVTADPALSGVRDGKSYYMTDAGIALENGVLAAAELAFDGAWGRPLT